MVSKSQHASTQATSSRSSCLSSSNRPMTVLKLCRTNKTSITTSLISVMASRVCYHNGHYSLKHWRISMIKQPSQLPASLSRRMLSTESETLGLILLIHKRQLLSKRFVICTSSSSRPWKASREHRCLSLSRFLISLVLISLSMQTCKKTSRIASTWMLLKNQTNGPPNLWQTTQSSKYGTKLPNSK